MNRITHIRRHQASRAAIAALFLAAALAGCTTSPTGPGGADGASAAGDVTIGMGDLAFDPVTVTVAPGTTVTWVNTDSVLHTVTPVDASQWGGPGSGDDRADWMKPNDVYQKTFRTPGTYVYYCIPHAFQGEDGEWRGMVATVVVSADAPAGSGFAGASAAARSSMAPAMQVPDVTEIGRSASDVPPPIGRRGPTDLTFAINATEVVGRMGDGISYKYWTFDDTVPGPMLRARVDDTITIDFHNDLASTMGHNIDFHAVTGPGGGAAALNAAPGETKSLTFKALHPGLYVYHCAFQNPPMHIAHGMYGLILIEPAGGLPPVDKEFYVMQGDFYSRYPHTEQGHHSYHAESALSEIPSFVVFNGRMGSLQDVGRQLEAEVGETVRLFVGNGGPNLVSSFHVIGEIFDTVYREGSLVDPPAQSLQTTLVPAGGAVVVDIELEVPGDFFLVDHSIFRIQKGAFGVLHVEGEANEEVFAPEQGP